MALQIPDETEQDPRKRREAASQDPLFYQGLTPVLGQDVSIQEPKGELSFPQASPTAVSPVGGPGEPPTPPQFPAFPSFDLGMPPEWNFEYTVPQPIPPGAFTEMGPGAPDVPWWAKAINTALKAEQLGRQAYNLYDLTKSTPYPEPSTVGSEAVGPQVSPAGESAAGPVFPRESAVFDVSDYAATQGITPPVTPPVGGEVAAGGGFPEPGLVGSEAVGPQGLGGGIEGTGTPTGVNLGQYAGPALNALGLGIGAYNLATAEPGSLQQMAAIPTTLGSGAALAAAPSIGLLAPEFAAMGPVGALVSAPLISGMIYENFFRGDRARFPESYAPLPTGARGKNALAVDPATGRVMVYRGNGRYAWSDETLQGRPLTPEQFKQYGIMPEGALLNVPEYAAIARNVRDDAVAAAAGLPEGTTFTNAAGQPLGTGAPSALPGTNPKVDPLRSFFEEWRQPIIDRIKAQYPGRSEGEWWRLYTLTPEYQQELAMLAQWGPQGPTGGGGEGGGGAPSGGGPELGGGLMG